MSILGAIWNGPFDVGKLTQPVSVGDVLLKILEVLWRGLNYGDRITVTVH